MPKFVIRLHGTGCRIRTTRRRWLLFRESVIQSVGFYTTRFIEAPQEQKAITEAISLAQEQLKNNDIVEMPRIIEVDEIYIDEEAYDSFAPGNGFTWY